MIYTTFQTLYDKECYPLEHSRLTFQNQYDEPIYKVKILATFIHPFGDRWEKIYEINKMLPGKSHLIDLFSSMEYDFLKLEVHFILEDQEEVVYLSFKTWKSNRSVEYAKKKDGIKVESDLLLSQEIKEELVAISEMRQKMVLILGKDSGEELAKLRKIQGFLRKKGMCGLLLKDYDDIATETNEEKLVRFTSLVDFVIVEYSLPGGQIDELKILSILRKITAILHEAHKGATWMQSDYDIDFPFMKYFPYNQLNDSLLTEVLDWAFDRREDRKRKLNERYPWRH